MIVCWRTVRVPPDRREQFQAWIHEHADVRRRHGILLELVLERSSRQNPAKAAQPEGAVVDEDELVVMTAWPDHDTFDAWIGTPDRDRLTASSTHEAVEFRPLTRYDVVGGYGADALTTIDPTGGRS